MTASTKIKPITAAEILAAIKDPAAPSNEDTIGDKFVGWTADKVDSAGVATARLFGALQASGENFTAHRKLELGVQTHRANQRLARAAERAARILNS
jgi:hypothetical protein